MHQNIEAIHTVVIHCSATKRGVWVDAASIDVMHKRRGFDRIGYHWVIRNDGTLEPGRPMDMVGAHVKGNNTNSIGICISGGLDSDGNPVEDNFEDEQMECLRNLLWSFHYGPAPQLPGMKIICGHRDFSPDLDGDGLIEREEWIKQCPCFDVGQFLSKHGLARYRLIPGQVNVADLI